MSRLRRRLAVGLTTAAMVLTMVPPAQAQLPELPQAPSGALGAILDPLEDLLYEITEPLGDALGGTLPLNNAVRLTGTDAVEASVALSRITFPESDIALIGRDDVFADTLSSVAAQGIAGAPLLLTPSDALDDRTAEELTRLGATEVIVLGSTEAISEELEQELVDYYGEDNVTRVGGPSRVETSVMLAEEIAPDATDAILLRAYNDPGADQSQAYADALSVGPYGSTQEWPALLTTTDSLHPYVEDYLEGSAIERITIVGGEAAVSAAVESSLTSMGIEVTRIAGSNRWQTAVMIANAMGMDDASDANRMVVSEGGAIDEPLWAAGFAAASHGAVYESPVLLVDGALLPPETMAFMGDGLINNALRMSNLPVVCNSFVSFLACETVALLMLGQLDAVNDLTGGALEMVLGPVFEPLAETLSSIIPAPDGMSPGLIGQILSLIGVGGTEDDTPAGPCEDGIDNDEDGEIDEADECEAAFADAMAAQPATFQQAVLRMVGPEGDRISPTRQQAITEVLADLNEALPGPVDLSDPAQADAVATIFDTITGTLDDQSGSVPLGELNELLTAVEQLIGDLVDALALADMVGGLGVDGLPVVDDLLTTVGDLLTGGGSGFLSADQTLVQRYGAEAGPLQQTVNRLAARASS